MSGTLSPAYSPEAHFDGTWSATPITIVICSAIAGYNAVEGLVLILSTFRQYKSLYFRSLIVAAADIIFYMTALILWYFALTNRLVALVILYIGWICMVTGQSVVLYSRLGIVMGAERDNISRMVKWMIATNAVVFHITTIVISLCSFYAPDPKPAARAYYYIERLQITAFGAQELIISGLYIWRTLDILRTSVRAHHRRIIVELLIVNLILVSIDTGTVTLEYCNLFFFEVAFKMVSYSSKLKLEFAILSKLMVLSGADESTRNSRGDSLAFQTSNMPTAADPFRPTSALFEDHELSSHAEKSQSGMMKTSGITSTERHCSPNVAFQETTSMPEQSLENYADIMRALSKG